MNVEAVSVLMYCQRFLLLQVIWSWSCAKAISKYLTQFIVANSETTRMIRTRDYDFASFSRNNILKRKQISILNKKAWSLPHTVFWNNYPKWYWAFDDENRLNFSSVFIVSILKMKWGNIFIHTYFMLKFKLKGTKNLTNSRMST